MINILYKKITSDIDVSNIPENELNRIAKYGSKKRRDESLNGLFLLGKVLEMYGINTYELSYTEKGKPYIDNLKYHFNISHSNEYVVCAVSDKEVGIDIEMVKDKITNIKPKITDEEMDDPDSLTELWTLKESFIKYLGIGITMDLKKIKVKREKDFFEINYLNNTCYAKMLKIDNYYISVCQASKIIDHLVIKKYN